MLHYLDELMTAMNATPGRRWFNIASAVLIVVIFGTLARVGVSSWIIVPALCIEFVCHGALVNSWARKDALEAYRQSERASEP
ncbi:Na+/alanine symporter [Arthrobacter sp. AZCC_0090]|nr:Na+/alanine symporter [Arthrobacter sp. AZCC_0090]